uniref:Transposase (Putative), gypsy type n=1 Tax=Tanacetum cinerariifolium TaxID=118510 RepID=A0A699GVT4_TANCI|nr:hypothetical protein [Tanacetum cinerariifolium]
MVRDNVQLETAVNTISHEYLLEFTSEYGIPEMLHPELPGPGDRIVDFPEGKVGWMSFSKRPRKNTPQCYTMPLDSLKNWNNRFFWVDERVFPTVVDWRTHASKDGMPVNGTYSVEAVRALDTHRTPIHKQPEMLLCLVGISRRYYLGDEVNGPIQFDSCPKSYKGEDWEPPPCPHEVPLLTLTASRVIKMDEPAVATDSSGVPSAIEKSPLVLAHEDGASDQGTAALEMPPPEDVPATAAPGVGQAEEAVEVEPPVARESRKRGHDKVDANAPPKSLRRDHADLRPSGAPADVSDPDPLSFADAPLRHPVDVAQSSQGIATVEDPESENVSSPVEVEQYNVNLARQDKRIEARELEIKNLEALLEAEAEMKRAAEDKSAGLVKELEDMRARFSDLQVSHGQLSQQVALLKEQVSGEEKLKTAFEEFKRYEDERVEQRCAELDARLDALSIDFDEELYPHIFTAIAGRMWVVGHGLRLAMMKCAESLEMRQAFADVVSAGVAKGMSEGLKHGVEHGQAQLTVESIEAYDPEAEAKFVAALQSLKDLNYHLLDQLEGLKAASMDVIMAALYLESDTRGDAPQYIRDLRPSSSQLTILVYPEVRDPRNPWAYKEEIKLSDAIAANISRAEKKKKMPHSMPYSRGRLCTSCQVGRHSGVCTRGGPSGSCPFAGGCGYAD